MDSRKEKLLYHPIFIVSLILLILNDNFLKYEYHNWLTGKLSDFSGLIVLPIFLSLLFPKHSRFSVPISAILFSFWKLPISSDFIDFINAYSFMKLERVIDYTDFIALTILPISNWMIVSDKILLHKHRINQVLRLTILLTTFFSLCSTSINRMCTTPEGTIYIGKQYKLKVPKDTVLSRILELGFEYKTEILNPMDRDSDSTLYFSNSNAESVQYYINDIVVPINELNYCGSQDTIQKLTFSFYDFSGIEYLTIKDVTFSDTLHLSDWKEMKKYSKMYNKIAKDLFINESIKK